MTIDLVLNDTLTWSRAQRRPDLITCATTYWPDHVRNDVLTWSRAKATKKRSTRTAMVYPSTAVFLLPPSGTSLSTFMSSTNTPAGQKQNNQEVIPTFTEGFDHKRTRYTSVITILIAIPKVYRTHRVDHKHKSATLHVPACVDRNLSLCVRCTNLSCESRRTWYPQCRVARRCCDAAAGTWRRRSDPRCTRPPAPPPHPWSTTARDHYVALTALWSCTMT